LIRLATAHAKARLSPKVEETDAQEAEVIMRFALFKEVPKRERRKKRKLNTGGASRQDGDSEGEESDEEPATPARMSMPPQGKDKGTPTPEPAPAPVVPHAAATQDPIWGDESQDVTMDVDELPVAGGATEDGKIAPQRFVCRFNSLVWLTFLCIDYNSSAPAWLVSWQRRSRTLRLLNWTRSSSK
jgi:DNA replication licensing factor MCM3